MKFRFLLVLSVALVSCGGPKVGLAPTSSLPGVQIITQVGERRLTVGDEHSFRVLANSWPGDDSDSIATVHKGELCPFDGTLLSAGAAARIIAELESVDAKVAAEVKKTEDIERAKCALEAAKAAADRKAEKTVSDKQIAARDAQIKAMNKQLASQQSPMFWMGLGVAGGATVTVLTVLAVSAASK